MPLDARELSQRVKTLTSSLSKNDPPADIIAQLDLLKKEPAPTEEILRSTKAGVVIAKLNKNPNKEIAKLASDIVLKWRKSVEAEKKARAAKGQPSPSPAPAAKPTSPKLSAGAGKKFEGDLEKRDFRKEGIDKNRTGNAERDNVIGLLWNGLAYRCDESADFVLQRALEVENALYKLFNNSTPMGYKEKCRSLFSNLKGKTNAELGQSVMSGEVSAAKFVRMSGQELMSAEQRKINAEIEKENIRKAQVPMAEKSVSEELTCGNCKQKKVSYTQAQTRSADEPMTTFCECMNCGKRWKFS